MYTVTMTFHSNNRIMGQENCIINMKREGMREGHSLRKAGWPDKFWKCWTQTLYGDVYNVYWLEIFDAFLVSPVSQKTGTNVDGCWHHLLRWDEIACMLLVRETVLLCSFLIVYLIIWGLHAMHLHPYHWEINTDFLNGSISISFSNLISS